MYSIIFQWVQCHTCRRQKCLSVPGFELRLIRAQLTNSQRYGCKDWPWDKLGILLSWKKHRCGQPKGGDCPGCSAWSGMTRHCLKIGMLWDVVKEWEELKHQKIKKSAEKTAFGTNVRRMAGCRSYDGRQNLHPSVIAIHKKVTVKWSRYRPGMAQRVGRGIALLFHDRGTRRGVSGQQHAPAALYPRERPGTHCTEHIHS